MFIIIFLNRFFYLFRLTFIKIILGGTLQKPEVCCAIFHLTRSFIGNHLSLTFPPFYIPAAKKFVSLPLADKFRIILVGFQLPDNSGGEVIQECFVWYKMVQKLQYLHINLIWFLYYSFDRNGMVFPVSLGLELTVVNGTKL